MASGLASPTTRKRVDLVTRAGVAPLVDHAQLTSRQVFSNCAPVSCTVNSSRRLLPWL